MQRGLPLERLCVCMCFLEIFPLAAEGTISPLLLQEKDLDAEPEMGFSSGKNSKMLNGG